MADHRLAAVLIVRVAEDDQITASLKLWSRINPARDHALVQAGICADTL
ncbi:hypothetical protein [Novosphingobium sp.]|nr:hypothetical protein [Novosphingobium sp.]